MKHLFHKLPVLSFVVAAVLLGSCRENTIINAKISPANNALGVFNTTLSCITRTIYNDTVQTSLNYDGIGITVAQAVGKLTDPYFGNMTASTFLQVTPTNFSDAIYSGATIQSAVLVLPYSFTYGDTTDQTVTQTYEALYMTDTLTAGAPYYSYSDKPVDEGTPLSDPITTNVYHLKDSVTVNGKVYGPSLVIPLKKDILLSHLLPALADLATSTSPTTQFYNAFKGVCVRPTASSGSVSAIPYFRLNGSGAFSQAAIIVYYKNSAGIDTFEQYYYSTSTNSHFNKIAKSYSTAPVNTLYTQPVDSIAGLQNQPGANIDIKIGGITSLPKGLINKAEVQLSVLPNYVSPLFFAPIRLYVRGIGNGVYPAAISYNATYEVVDRYPLASTAPFIILDGYSHQLDRNGTTVQTYTLNIPREVMASQAAGNDTLHLRITGTEDLFGAGHLIVGGGNHANPIYKARLFVVYSAIQ